ncbi:hypothetical protein FG386_002599 [Cryptosporidium ryanae]|uniref:uncharacterized protein n=1 Tax=Cryptosporidium ryanae TaxID=515981 RepID=UPI00351A3EBA|nr:hypothetical protein FG386_002599 [Cryptosporidium ryanae]
MSFIEKILIEKKKLRSSLFKVTCSIFDKISHKLFGNRKLTSYNINNTTKIDESNLITLHILRHSESLVNVHLREKKINLHKALLNHDPGFVDSNLSEEGTNEAIKFGENGGPMYKGKPLIERSSLMLCSNLIRAMETLKHISKRAPKDCEYYVLDELREKALFLSDTPIYDKNEIKEKYPQFDVSSLPEDKVKVNIPESNEELETRINNLKKFLINYNFGNKNNEVIIVSHLFFIKSLLKKSLFWELPNLGLCTVKLDRKTGDILEFESK